MKKKENSRYESLDDLFIDRYLRGKRESLEQAKARIKPAPEEETTEFLLDDADDE